MLTIGTHMSIAGGIAKTAENVVKMEANTMQIFSRNPRGSNYKTYTSEEIEKFQSIRMEHHFGPILAHAPYTMNLASATEKTYEFASMVIREDIQRMDELGLRIWCFIREAIRGLVQMPGFRILSGAGSGSDGRPEYSRASGNYEWKRYRDWCDI